MNQFGKLLRGPEDLVALEPLIAHQGDKTVLKVLVAALRACQLGRYFCHLCQPEAK